ncbi:hypothetical protein [Streptomyces sp. NPDC046727]|uniref:hypothetical protein n=1 Tax=Streptomyces sp. NPDC046727 TaxID=3155373 RepID=UPI0033D08028
MISTRRIVAALGVAAGVTGLAAPLAHAAEASAAGAGRLSPMATVDSLTVSHIPAQYRAGVPRVSEQTRAMDQIDDLNRLNELWQVTGPVAPVLGLLPAVRA